MPGNPVGRLLDEHPERSYRGKVHGNCVTVSQSVPRATLHPTVYRSRRHNPLTRDTGEGTITANGIVLATAARKVRSPIDWTRPTIARAFSLSVPNSTARENICTNSGYDFASYGTKRERERALSVPGNVFSGRVIYLPVEMKRK